MSNFGAVTFFWGMWKIVAFVFLVLRDSLLTFNHSLIFVSSMLMFTFVLNIKVLRVLEREVLSAYIIAVKILLTRVIIYINNK